MPTCAKCITDFEITDADKAFYEKISPKFGGKKYLIPNPTLCPSCREQRRLAFRNERSLYNDNCKQCGKNIVSIYNPKSNLTVYCKACWWGDKWNALDYGQDFDFSRSFFEQFNELNQVVPKAATICFDVGDNCEYTNYQNESRNCYMTFGSGNMEDCMYTNWVYYAKNSVDCSFCSKSERDYMNVDCTETYHCKFCQDVKNSSDCSFSYDLRNCRDCFGCVGLRNKQYFIFNKPMTKEQYFDVLPKLNSPKNWSKIMEEVTKLKDQHPHLSARIINSENCTGDDIENSKNCHDCYTVNDCEDSKWISDVFSAKDAYDGNRTGLSELIYESSGGGYYFNTNFMWLCGYVKNSNYCFEVMNSNNTLGCVGINHNNYTIFNKKYSKEEFETLASKIIEHMQESGEWGEFFPSEISLFGYNETVAQEYYPLTKEVALNKGFRWHDENIRDFKEPTYKIPEVIDEVPDSVVKEVLQCEITGQNYRIVPQELAFYRQEGLPIPKRSPHQRFLDRINLRNPRKLFNRACDKCQTDIQTTYSPDREEKVYCEQCYLSDIY